MLFVLGILTCLTRAMASMAVRMEQKPNDRCRGDLPGGRPAGTTIDNRHKFGRLEGESQAFKATRGKGSPCRSAGLFQLIPS
ncbi:hypothetical protein [Methylobacterium sp. Leaf117]|uniref:hypothetical protein n=1 Tax=Methylobacterium sp. Leaf117 TaxID=1736260 RepID=UPI000B308196|nr:hypothetical protein [Methylobacterium sp. Leaf117]